MQYIPDEFNNLIQLFQKKGWTLKAIVWEIVTSFVLRTCNDFKLKYHQQFFQNSHKVGNYDSYIFSLMNHKSYYNLSRLGPVEFGPSRGSDLIPNVYLDLIQLYHTFVF